MAQANTIRFGKSMILLGDGATPTEIFTAPCGLEELTMTMQINSTDTAVPDCSDPDLAAWLQTDIVSMQMRLSGNGVLDTAAMQTWQAWYFGTLAGKERNVRWYRNLTGANGGGYFMAPGVLTAYSESGRGHARYTASIAIALNGKPTFTANA